MGACGKNIQDHCPQLGQAECYTYSRVPGGAHDVTAAAALPRRRVSDFTNTARATCNSACSRPDKTWLTFALRRALVHLLGADGVKLSTFNNRVSIVPAAVQFRPH